MSCRDEYGAVEPVTFWYCPRGHREFTVILLQ
jgi:hypothetical protein